MRCSLNYKIIIIFLYLGHIKKHKDKVADTSAHYKEMENLMGAEKLMSAVKYWKLQGIYDAADGVNNTAGEEPSKSRVGQHVPERPEYREADPSHGNINEGRKPFRTGDPAGV